MSHNNIQLTKRVDFVALEHLTKRNEELFGNGKNPEVYAKCQQAMATLFSELGVNPKNKKDAYNLGFDATLRELVVAGSEVLGSNASHKRPNEENDLQTSSKFLKYVETVKKKGAFNGLVEGSPEYQQTMDKVKKVYLDRFEPKQPVLSTEEAEKAAEKHKLEGNDKLSASDYNAAIACYDKAIELSPSGPNTHIYLSNRAAAYTHLKEYEKAAEDCSASIALKPDFAKAYSRLASAQLNMNMLDEAEKNSERALELDATNGVALAALDKIRQMRSQTVGRTGAASAPRGGGAMMPPMGGMPGARGGGMPGGMPGMGGGGMPDLASMMSDPAMQSMMNDPAMMAMAQQMMQNPAALGDMMKNMGKMMGGKQ